MRTASHSQASRFTHANCSTQPLPKVKHLLHLKHHLAGCHAADSAAAKAAGLPKLLPLDAVVSSAAKRPRARDLRAYCLLPSSDCLIISAHLCKSACALACLYPSKGAITEQQHNFWHNDYFRSSEVEFYVYMYGFGGHIVWQTMCAGDYEVAHTFATYANWLIRGRLMLGLRLALQKQQCPRFACHACELTLSTCSHLTRPRKVAHELNRNRKNGEQQIGEILDAGITTFVSF